jgi:hypothetical protein
MSGKLTEAERIEWRVWYFLPFAKMDELPRGCAFPRSVSQAVVEIIINGALRNVRDFFKNRRVEDRWCPLRCNASRDARAFPPSWLGATQVKNRGYRTCGTTAQRECFAV